MQWVFADCVLDLERRDLRRASQPVATTPKTFDLLVYLASHHDRVVSRDELIDAVWGGRTISESTVASHVNAARTAVGDDGQQQRIIKTVARRGFRFVADLAGQDIPPCIVERTATPSDSTSPDTALSGKPSIAILPFVNLSGDPNQDYLADGVIEDVIIALSRYRWLFVVARNSSFTYKNRDVDVKQIGRELGVRYVLEGSWRQAQGRVRITGRLVNASSGATHWADRFEGVLGSLFEFQDRIADSVVGAIAPQLEQAEIARARHKPTGSLDAYDYYLRGMAQLHLGTREAIDEALPLFHRAFDCDADFSSAYAMAAWCHCWRKINGWMSDHPKEMLEGTRLAHRAVRLGKYDAVALARSGHALAHLAGDLPEGIELLDRALELNPNLASAWFLGAFCRLWHGESTRAVEQFTRAMDLSPVDPELYRIHFGLAAAHLFLGKHAEAASYAEKASRDLPSFFVAQAVLASSLAWLGKLEEARRAAKRLHALAPALRLGNLTDVIPIVRQDDLNLLIEGLAKAGFQS
ncbi:winged helix-turn-helix domain-containing tetratricopeptide repeat protein [Burkholderia sp. RF2-non_BP3]|uniref:winged helix-turn-helix domain-containing tetratricopeptide repeat protein n=1 Tax=Burkholderia sp. RF2-non_BP3 TaxID=1637844 RepID=UPI000756EB0D|nr:winged helix-turn-helix domain-containing tetratricopeptide repeat protein [Burkholderia sp. RF2-non_BP3]KUY61139.1 CadC-family transcriptional regulator [Burkholderia sp. RF2-non_BP3]